MSEFIGRRQEREIALVALRKEQIEIEERTRRRVLTEGHFHEWFHGNEELLQGRLDTFLDEKENKNMGERFALAISSEYLDIIRLVELGTADAPFQTGELDGLKHEYNDLKDWLISHGIIENEMSREQSGRSLEIYQSGIAKDRVVVGRNRPLITGTIMTTDGAGRPTVAQFDIAKRMVFSMPKALQQALLKKFENEFIDRDGSLYTTGEDPLRIIESAIDDSRKYDFDAIRTSYYLTARSLPDSHTTKNI